MKEIIKGACAKVTTRCTIVTDSGDHVVGENWCANPQPTCPRLPGEGYEKCKSICQQYGHAEEMAVKLAGSEAMFGRAYLEGHTHYCMSCQHALFGAGVKSLALGKPPVSLASFARMPFPSVPPHPMFGRKLDPVQPLGMDWNAPVTGLLDHAVGGRMSRQEGTQ